MLQKRTATRRISYAGNQGGMRRAKGVSSAKHSLAGRAWHAQDIAFTHGEVPRAVDVLHGCTFRVTLLTLSAGLTVHCQSMSANLLLLLTAQEVIQSEWISNTSQRGPNLVMQIYHFNPKRRRLVSVLIQHLCSRAHFCFPDNNFPWNLCEAREHSELAFVSPWKNRDHVTRFSPPVTLMLIFLPAHLDLTNSSHLTSPPDTTFHLAMHQMEIALSCCGAQEISFSLHLTPVPNSPWGIRL